MSLSVRIQFTPSGLSRAMDTIFIELQNIWIKTAEQRVARFFDLTFSYLLKMEQQVFIRMGAAEYRPNDGTDRRNISP